MAYEAAVASLTGVQKQILAPGRGEFNHFDDGTKITFHYTTRLCDDDKTVLDESKKDCDGKPMELVVGKKFKLEIWESCLKTTREGEVASFTVEPLVGAMYPMVMKSLRDIRTKKVGHVHTHQCGMSLKEHGLGYPDLDKLLKKPEKLEFIFEVLKVEVPGQYNKDTWAMSVEEKLESVPKLKDEGNALFKEKKYKEASDIYAKAIGLLEQLLLREKPGEPEYIDIDMKKVPLLLNYSQCLLFMNDYYPVIEHTTEVLNKEPDNVKALYRRAKAHIGAWNPEEAKKDFNRVLELDQSLKGQVNKELHSLMEMEKKKEEEDKAKLKGKLFS